MDASAVRTPLTLTEARALRDLADDACHTSYLAGQQPDDDACALASRRAWIAYTELLHSLTDMRYATER